MIIKHPLEPGQSTWKQSDAISNKAWLAIHKLSWSTRLVAGCTDNGIWYSDDGGQHWIQSNITTGSIETFSSNVFTSSGNTTRRIFAGYSGGILYSDDNGEHWTQSSVTNQCNSIVTLSDPQRVVASTPNGSLGQVIYSDDKGINWESAGFSGGGLTPIIMLLCARNTGNLLAVPTSPGSIFHGDGSYFSKGGYATQLGNFPEDIIYHAPSGCYIVTGGQNATSGLFCVAYNGRVTGSVSNSLSTQFMAIWNMPDTDSNTFIAMKSDKSIYKITKSGSGNTYTCILFNRQVPAYPRAGIAITVNNNTRFVICTDTGIYYADPEEEVKETSFITKAGVQELVTQAKAYIDSL